MGLGRAGLGRGQLGRMPHGGVQLGNKIIINGVDRSLDVGRKSPLTVTDILTSQVDSATFFMAGLAEADVPVEGQEVIISGPGFRRFGGIIASVERVRIGPNDDGFKVRCQDFSKLLEKKLVTRVYDTGLTAGAIIKDIVDNFVLDDRINTDDVQDGPVIDFISFNFKSATQCFKEISKLTQFDWFIDGSKRLQFFSKSTNVTPFNLEPGVFDYRKLRVRPDTSQLKNRVIVRGGSQESASFTESYPGDNTRRTFPVSYVASDTPTITVNATGKTVGIKNQDEGNFDFLFDPNTRVIENDNEPILNPSETLNVTYTFKIPILVQVEDPSSISAVAAVEGSDGIYEFLIVDDSIETLDAARERAQAEITRFGSAIFSGQFNTDIDGFRSGQLIRLNFPDKNLVIELLVTKVTFKSIGCGAGFYDVRFGTFSFDWQDFLLGLIQSSRGISVREGEILDDLLSPQETVNVIDQNPTVTLGPALFQWGPGAASPATWGSAQWA